MRRLIIVIAKSCLWRDKLRVVPILIGSLWLVFGLVLVGYTIPALQDYPTGKTLNPYQTEYEQMLFPTVRITTPAGVGSGVVIATTDYTDEHRLTPVYILTAAHVVGDENTVEVEFFNSVTLTASVVLTDTVKDLALLRTQINADLQDNLYVAKLASRDYTPYLFTPVYTVGCSLGLVPRPSKGIITAITTPLIPLNKGGLRGLSPLNKGGLRGLSSPLTKGDLGGYWEISAPIVPGNSGGGVFLQSNHQLIGIAVWVRTYHGQLITTMAGVVPLQDIYEFLERNGYGFITNNQELESYESSISQFSAGRCPEVETASSAEKPAGPRQTGAPLSEPVRLIDLTKRKGVINMPSEVKTHVILSVSLPEGAPERVTERWAEWLKGNAERMLEGIRQRFPDDVRFQSGLAELAHKKFRDFVNPAFTSRAGVSGTGIVNSHLQNIMRSFKKYRDGIESAFANGAEWFKAQVDRAKSHFSEGTAARTLPFTGSRREELGPAPIATMWLTGDPTAEGLIRLSDQILEGGPYRICTEAKKPALKALLQQRLVQAGAEIVKSGNDATITTQQNQLTNELVQGTTDPTLDLAPFAAGGDSRIDYIVTDGNLYLEIRVYKM